MAKKKTKPKLIRPASEFDPKNPETGFYDLPESIYRAAPGENWSNLKRIGKTAKSYNWFKDHPEPDTPDQKKGRLYHTLLLEPQRKDERWAVTPELYPAKGKKVGDPPIDKPWNMNAHFCQDWVADMEAKGFEVTKQGDVDFGNRMVGELRDLEDACKILDDADGYEVSGFWIDEESGLLCKMKLDILKRGQVGDFKKVASGHSPAASWESWCRHLRSWQHHGQAAFYRDGVNAIYEHYGWALPDEPSFIWLVVEDQHPFDTAIYPIIDREDKRSYQFFVWGRELYRQYIWQVGVWQKVGKWPSYNSGASHKTEALELKVPDWLNLEIRV